jgi:antirestriction protein ArdC
VAHDPRDNTAAYPASWLAVLKNDKKAIITAVAKAQAVVEYFTALQPGAGGEAA